MAPRDRPFFFLRPDETPLLTLRPARGYALALFLSLLPIPLLLLVGAGVALLYLPPPFGAVGFAVAAVALLVIGLFAWRRAATSEYALTDSRVYSRTGQLFLAVHFTTLDKMTDVVYRQGPVDRMLGLGSLVLATAGGRVRLAGLAEALEVKEAVEAARERFIQRLLDEAGLAVPPAPVAVAPVAPAPVEAPLEAGAVAPPAPVPAPGFQGARPEYVKRGDRILWFGKPRPISAVARVLPGLVPVLFVMVALQGAPWPILVGAIGLFLMISAGNVIRLRRTEYVVTDRGVYARSGLFGTRVAQLTYDKITDITYQQDILGRILGYGGLAVNTAGSVGAPVSMVGLGDALHVKEIIDHARSRALREETA